MSNLAVGLVWERSRAKGSNLLVLLAIADLADDDGRDFWQSNHRLGQKSRLSRRSLYYILHKLERDLEIVVEVNTEERMPKKSRGFVPERYIHVRCIYDWPQFQTEACAKIAQSTKQQRTKTLRADRAVSRAPAHQKLHSLKRKDLLVDLSVDLKAAPAAPNPVEIPRTDQATYAQLEAVVHDVAGGPDAFDGLSDFSEAVKMRCAELHLLYEPRELARAIASVSLVRGFRRSAKRRFR